MPCCLSSGSCYVAASLPLSCDLVCSPLTQRSQRCLSFAGPHQMYLQRERDLHLEECPPPHTHTHPNLRGDAWVPGRQSTHISCGPHLSEDHPSRSKARVVQRAGATWAEFLSSFRARSRILSAPRKILFATSTLSILQLGVLFFLVRSVFLKRSGACCRRR